MPFSFFWGAPGVFQLTNQNRVIIFEEEKVVELFMSNGTYKYSMYKNNDRYPRTAFATFMIPKDSVNCLRSQ